MRLILLTVVALMVLVPLYAEFSNDHSKTTEEWNELESKIGFLEDVALMPSLLPFVMRNRDVLELTDEQVAAFDQWRRDNYTPMVNLMNAIIEMKVQFTTESLAPEISDEHLLEFRREIQQLQQELLKLRLTCRKVIMNTFTQQQWENFIFLAADDPKLSSYLSMPANLAEKHLH